MEENWDKRLYRVKAGNVLFGLPARELRDENLAMGRWVFAHRWEAAALGAAPGVALSSRQSTPRCYEGLRHVGKLEAFQW